MSVQSSGVPGLVNEIEIGRGGFGVVYRATEVELGRTVAVKLLAPPRHQLDWERFDTERRTLAAVSDHPHIVTVYRTGRTSDNRPYLVMEYCRQGSLANRLDANGPLGWREVLEIAIEICDALHTAHRAGIVHRDLKPANILVSNHGEPLLADFGIAEVAGAKAAEPDDDYLTVSLAHVAPEIVTGADPDARSDVYSLASTCYELLTGQPPVVKPGDDTATALLRIASSRPPPLDPSVAPPPFAEALDAALSRSPGARPASAAAFGQWLTRILDATAPVPPSAAPTPSAAPPRPAAQPPPVAPATPGIAPMPPAPASWSRGAGVGAGVGRNAAAAGTPATAAGARPAPPSPARPAPSAAPPSSVVPGGHPAPVAPVAPWTRRRGPSLGALLRRIPLQRIPNHRRLWAAAVAAAVVGAGGAGWGLASIGNGSGLFAEQPGAVVFEGHSGTGVTVVALADGRLASTRPADNRLLIWDPDRPDVRPRTIELDPSTPAETLIALSDGRVALISERGSLQIWDPSEPDAGPSDFPRPASDDNAAVDGLVELEDGTIVTRTFLELWRWDPDQPGAKPEVYSLPQVFWTRRLTPQFGRSGPDLAVLPDRRVAAVVAGQVLLWSFETDVEPAPMRGGQSEVSTLLAADSSVVMLGETWIGVVDLSTGSPVVTSERSSESSVFPLADGRIILSEPGSVVVLDEHLEPIGSYEGHEDWLTSATLLADGRIASADRSGAIHVWDPESA